MTGRHAIVARLDGLGDMVICGPAIRAIAAGCDRVTVLAGPAGAAVARLLPGVDEVITWHAPWIAMPPATADRARILGIVDTLATLNADTAVILTSFHQSALPTALLLRMAGVGQIAAVSTDYPGSLLDVRLPEPPDAPEPLRMLEIARGAGFELPVEDDGLLQVEAGRPPSPLFRQPYVVVHPGAAAPARQYPIEHWAEVVAGLTALGWSVAVTGSRAEAASVAMVAEAAVSPGRAADLSDRLDVPAFAALLRDASVVAAANTGPAHLAAAVGTPVVSLFAPTVPWLRWHPYGVPTIRLGDPNAACANTRAVECPVSGHPCLAWVHPMEVVRAVTALAETPLFGTEAREVVG